VTGGAKKEALIGAVLNWEGTTIGTTTDTAGNFMLAWPDSFPSTLLIKFTGYKGKGIIFNGKSPDHILVNLDETTAQNEIVITDRQPASNFPLFQSINVEGITQRGLRKAACCNLSESFETNPTVDAAMTDAVTGAKKIQLLGLDGIYTQILFENLPLIRGLSSSYGLSYVPGTWVNSIYITKGVGSVTNGFESMAGQLNIFLLQPDPKADKFFINAYGNHLGRAEMNVHVNQQLNTNLGMTLLAHASTSQLKNDMNHDGFLDMPLYTQYNFLNRYNWKTSKGWEGQFGTKAVYEDRTGGQWAYNKSDDHSTSPAYGIGIRNRQAEVFNKAGYIFAKDGRSLGTMFTARYHDENMFFGRKEYSGIQQSLFASVLFQDRIDSTENSYTVGASFYLDDYREKFNDSAFSRTQMIPGIFFEYNQHITDKFTIVAGIRGDDDNISGAQLTPRLHLKYDIGDKTAIRISGGKGFRTANVFPENNSIFANSRKIIVEARDFTEIAWNYGGSVTRKFSFLKNDATFIIDFFRTDFTKQVIMNMENPGVLKIQELNGVSFANSFQVDLVLEPVKRFDVRMAYKYYDVETTYDGVLKTKALTPQHRVFLNLAYALPYDKWTFDFTTKWIGPTRLPEATVASTPSYFLLSAQVGRKYPKLELYAGAENLLNYKQKDPVIAANDPFGPDFDATRIYAPTEGITVYAGLRLKIN
ncbi:MAG TPA: TonB-dependent receptor, partial [Bacteroidia bacterium]|nr:TonB-dependent receptor [Bacteroidia bacterium]